MSPPAEVSDASSHIRLDDQDDHPRAVRTAGAGLAHKRALAHARRRARGRARSAHRLEHEPFAPPPGWQHRPALDGHDVLVDQTAALERVRELVDAERWRADRHRSWSAMLAALVNHMDWETGLATITRGTLAAVGRVDVRTVTTMIRWARDVGLLAVIEAGATAAFLGTDRNRAQTYAVTIPAGTAPTRTRDDIVAGTPSDLHGDARIYPPTSYVKDLTLEERLENRQTPRRTPAPSWPLWRVPETSAERSAAAEQLALELGITHRVPAWRLRALLTCWWAAGACVSGLRYAVHHHPDRPNGTRGSALHGAEDPIRILGHRLRPWLGRLDDLPATLHGRRGDYQAEQALRVADAIDRAEHAPPRKHRPTSSPSARAAALAAIPAGRFSTRRRTSTGRALRVRPS